MKRTFANKLSLLQTLLKASRSTTTEKRHQGFTMIELLVVVIIAGGIISGLLYLVVELLTADRSEASRTQTQQEMQMALDYISAELREAVYIYDQECMTATATGSPGDGDYCPGLYNHIPTTLTPANDNYPILAFWKKQILPSPVREACDAGTAPTDTPCVSGHSYALIVYTLDTDDADNTWDGLARIRRYTLTRFSTTSGSPGYQEIAGYVDPGEFQQQFRSWPYYRDDTNSTPVDQQDTLPTGNGDVLVDFVDDWVRDDETSVACPGDPDNNPATFNNQFANTPDEYALTSDPTIVKTVANSFYACVSNRQDIGENRNTIVFLRGNAQGRPAIAVTPQADAYLPTLQTNVLSRPVIDKAPTGS